MRVAIIPARGGSERIPRKNIRPFHGKPILAYSIETARASGLFDHVAVSSEDSEILKVAKQYGALPIEREMKYAFDEVGTQEVTADALVELSLLGIKPEYACCIYATAPLLTAHDLILGWAEMMALPFGMTYAFVEGWYYWGRAKAFGHVPLDVSTAARMDVGERWIDINNEEDWKRVEALFAGIEDERRSTA